MNAPGVVTALAAESRTLGPVGRRGELLVLADGTLIVVSGVGGVAAAEGARRLVAAGASGLVSFGVAGGLDPALAAGTLVLPSEVISVAGARYPTAREWSERVGATLAGQYPVSRGQLLSCTEPLGSAADKALAFRRTAAVAVDMESLAVAEIAARHGLPFLTVRSVVDTAADPLPRTLLAIVAAGGAIPIARLIGSLARAPRELPRVVRIARRYRAARRTLVAVARSGALTPPAAYERATGLA